MHTLIGEIYFSSLAIQTHPRLPCQAKLMAVALGFRSFGQTRSCPFSRVFAPPYVCPWPRSEVPKGFAQKDFARLLLIIPWCPLFKTLSLCPCWVFVLRGASSGVMYKPDPGCPALCSARLSLGSGSSRAVIYSACAAGKAAAPISDELH